MVAEEKMTVMTGAERAAKFRAKYRDLCNARTKECREKKPDYYRKKVAECKKKYVDEGRCPNCSTPLVEGEKKYCSWCNTNSKRRPRASLRLRAKAEK